MPPVTKSLIPTIIDRPYAETIDCSVFYAGFKERLMGSRVILTVRGATQEGERYYLDGEVKQIPNLPIKLASVCPVDFKHFAVFADYTADYLLPYEKMTRADFLMEQLGILEAMRNRVSPHLKEIATEIDLVMEYVKNLYSTKELADVSYLETNINPT